jgi:hypothetical protein
MKTLTRAGSVSTFSKPSRLIESATSEPIRVIQEVFRCVFLEDLRDDLLPKWLRTALINDHGIYANAEHRSMLLDFYDQLLILTEAIQVFSEQQSKLNHNNQQEDAEESNKPVLLTSEQIANPVQVIAKFRQQFAHNYARRELWYFLEAGVTYGGDYPNGFTPGYALMAYDYLNCLIDAAYNLGD